jgi:hypothetical protein
MPSSISQTCHIIRHNHEKYMLEVENRGYYDLFDVTISLNNNNNLLGEHGRAANIHAYLLSRNHLTDISENFSHFTVLVNL